MFSKINGIENLSDAAKTVLEGRSDLYDDVDKMTFAWCEDAGYLYSKDTKMVKIFTSYSFDNDKLTIGNVTVFPRCIVKKIIVEK